MKRTFLVVALAAAACTGAPLTVQAQEGVDKAAAAAFDNRMFAGPPGAKAYACFVRRYDENHLAQHPKQKVSAMKLLGSAEDPPEDKATNYSFRLGVTYRHRSGNFDSSGYCNHAIAAESGREIRFECGVDCEGGGITVGVSRDNRSAIARLGRIMVWNRNKPDDDAGEALFAGADDKIFRVDRVDLGECAEPVTDRKELAALRHK
ncbi:MULTISPECIES: hypothetical protein [Bradyrhizobium]|uniref:DUF3617 family protein n=1 Tax=Bradyrhizobium elkanii TaxID=29448 RepID=A0A8I2C4Z0_BRAEL|nr:MULTISPECIES: hypothetical protein [Bradyrhizobium]MBP1295224.1 hypothetical protein [Bradyrhizobium elkanii]MCP1933876.1 hypothetical protein [Bradyrhizobium elkanii]MCS3478116.1 hypothetical protein [Bradyrhizobium elkanii]MCS3584889.1 hypothetical protein [Bradyrhizobium elkanii]MCS3718464.1 hypothetical protein [Bradyrhizobium elkanii]